MFERNIIGKRTNRLKLRLDQSVTNMLKKGGKVFFNEFEGWEENKYD
jgi:hypothetical protein